MKTLPKSVETQETRVIIIKLVQLLKQDWNAADTSDETIGEDPIKILATRLHTEANALDQSQFACTTQLDVEEPETYNKAMQGPHAAQWSQAMKGELDSLYENNTWIRVPKEEIQTGHRPLGGKWVL